MEKTLLPMPMQRQIGRVQVEDNLRGCDQVRFQKHVD